MKGLKIDYAMNNGHIMTVERKTPFHKQEMNLLEMNMLHANDVPSLLPISWNEVDGELMFSFSIQSYRLLAHFYQPGSITMLEYYSLLLSLVDCLATCYDYMLRPECCLLNEKQIYIDPKTSTVALAYIPISNREEDFQQQLLLLAVRWSALVDQIDHEGYEQILRELSVAVLSMNPIRQLLLSLIHQASANGYTTEPSEKSSFDYDVELNLLAKEELVSSNDKSDIEHSASFDEIQQLRWNEIAEEEEDAVKNTRFFISVRQGLILILIGILIFAIWKQLYINDASITNLLLCGGITMVLLTIVMLVFKKQFKESWFHRKGEEQSDFDMITISTAFQRISSVNALSPSNLPQADTNLASASNIKDVTNELNSSSKLSKFKKDALPLATVALDNQEKTTYLGASEKALPNVLKRILHQNEQNITISDNQFLIGRADEGVHFRDEATGVSRVHLELDTDKGEVYVKDVGSRNGSYLNGQLMIAYKAYRLQPGDVVQLVSMEGPKYQLVS